MLVEMAIGDAYGAGFEFIKPQRSADLGMANDGRTYYPHPELPIGNGRYTDDTQMALGITEALLAGGEFLPEELAWRFHSTFKRDPRPGYGSRFYELLNECRSGAELHKRLRPESTRSGGPMRVGPIGLYADVETVKRFAILQAVVTHNTGEAMGSAAAIALMVHYLAYRKGPRAEVGEFIASHIDGHAKWAEDFTGWASVEAIPCAHRAITVVKNATSLTDVLIQSVAGGGDVDTVAAMAMFAASVAEDLPNDLDPTLYSGLENDRFGRDYLAGRDVELQAFARSQGARL